MARTVSLITGAPLQVLSLFEAQQAYDLDDESSVVVATPYAQSLMRGIGITPGSIISFNYIIGAGRRTYSSIRRMIRDVELELGGSEVKIAMVGTPGLLGRSLVSRLQPKQTVILEDGTATLKFLRDYDERQPRFSRGKSVIREGVLRSYGLTSQEISGADIFTPLEIDWHPFGRVVRHDFPRLRSRGSFSVVDEGVVLLLGRYENPDDDLMCRSKSMGLIGQGKTVLFKPHPVVSDPVAPKGSRLIDPAISRLPVEFALLQMGFVPGTIVGFGSSALLTLRSLVPAEVNVIDISELD